MFFDSNGYIWSRVGNWIQLLRFYSWSSHVRGETKMNAPMTFYATPASREVPTREDNTSSLIPDVLIWSYGSFSEAGNWH